MVARGKCMLTATPAMNFLVLNQQKLTKQRVISTVYCSEATDPSKLTVICLTATHASLTALLFTVTPQLCRCLRTMMSTFRTKMTTPRRRKLPRRGRGARVGAWIPAGPDGNAGGSGRARRGRRGGRHGDGRGDAGQAINTTLPDGTEVLWQPDNGMQPDWLQDLADATGKPTFDATDFRPVDYFERTFPIDFLKSLCVETNRYYAEWAQNPNANEQIKKAFTDVDIAEMKAFIAILIMTGLSRRRSYKSHWSTHWLLDMPGLRSVMTRDRFFAILRFLHVADNSVAIARGELGHDRAYKIRPMIRSLVAAWQAAYSIEKAVSIDECMIAFKGHVFMLQYMPKKPNKWGLKGLFCNTTKGLCKVKQIQKIPNNLDRTHPKHPSSYSNFSIWKHITHMDRTLKYT